MGKILLTYSDKKVFLPLRKHGIDLQFSGNNRNIVGKV